MLMQSAYLTGNALVWAVNQALPKGATAISSLDWEQVGPIIEANDPAPAGTGDRHFTGT